ncbi:hypothetical protein [Halorussus amylolyticus]|uniref:hypothetical protein n=1 Tax=Halorussus amylolyticus TaxID=1126242 RepID=UPI00104FE922|nr:hypothetical protein [Halorussus amylolyticus]
MLEHAPERDRHTVRNQQADDRPNRRLPVGELSETVSDRDREHPDERAVERGEAPTGTDVRVEAEERLNDEVEAEGENRR